MFWMVHLTDNTVTRTMQIKYGTNLSLHGVRDSFVPIYASEAVRNDPRFIEMSGRESACSLAIEKRLRSRTWSNISAGECDLSADKLYR
jgi:hypothetical protein